MSLKVCFLPTISSFPSRLLPISFRDLERRNVTAVYHKPHETTCWLATLNSHTYTLPFSVGPSNPVSCMQNANTYIFNFSVFYLKKTRAQMNPDPMTDIRSKLHFGPIFRNMNKQMPIQAQTLTHVETRFHSLVDLYWECIFICWFG